MSNPSLALRIKQLKEVLGDLMQQDVKLTNQFYLAHWLKGHKLNVEKTADAIRANLKWRKDNEIKELLNKKISPEFLQKFPMFFDKTGKDGRPVAYTAVGYLNPSQLCKEFGKAELMRHIAHVMIKMEKIVFDWDNEWKGNVEDLPDGRAKGFFCLDDATGFSFKNYASCDALNFVLEWSKYCLNYFPSAIRLCRVINASKIVQIPYRLTRPLVAGKGIDLDVVGNTGDDLRNQVFSIIEPKLLEEFQSRAKSIYERSYST